MTRISRANFETVKSSRHVFADLNRSEFRKLSSRYFHMTLKKWCNSLSAKLWLWSIVWTTQSLTDQCRIQGIFGTDIPVWAPKTWAQKIMQYSIQKVLFYYKTDKIIFNVKFIESSLSKTLTFESSMVFQRKHGDFIKKHAIAT